MCLRKHPLPLSQPLAAAERRAEQAGQAESDSFSCVPMEAEPHKRGSTFPRGLWWKISFLSSFEHLQYLLGIYVAGSNSSASPSLEKWELEFLGFSLWIISALCQI